MKPFSQASENNKTPILNALREVLQPRDKVLEVGSGTGQHAVFFGQKMPDITWQTSDLAVNHAGIQRWLHEAGLANVVAPLGLNVLDADAWPTTQFNAVYSANTAHIMPWEAVQAMLRHAPRVLVDGGKFILYGPFNYNGEYTSQSNRQFDVMLKYNDAKQGIRDFDELNKVAEAAGFTLLKDYEMPANNHLLVWQYQ